MTDQKVSEKNKHSRDPSEQKLQNKASIGDYVSPDLIVDDICLLSVSFQLII
jgi:hypothetical protein